MPGTPRALSRRMEFFFDIIWDLFNIVWST
jgi:hypothetical protein